MSRCLASRISNYLSIIQLYSVISGPLRSYSLIPLFIKFFSHSILLSVICIIGHIFNLMQIKANKKPLKQALLEVALCGVVVASFGTVECCTVGYNDR